MNNLDMSQQPQKASAAPVAGADRRSVVPDLRVAFILAPRFTLITFASFVDSLRHAADEADRSRQIHCSWRVVAPTPEPIEASCGVSMVPTAALLDPA